MRIAIVGTGVSGLVAARTLDARRHELVLFEADARPGGHVDTHTLEQGGHSLRVDSGFMVFNETTYPHFSKLLADLGVDSVPTEMGFSVHCERSGLEWASGGPASLLAQPNALLRPRFLRMLRDALRFFREASALLESDDASPTLGEWLFARGYSPALAELFLVPLGASIWSASPNRLLDFPASAFARFLANHGLLSVSPTLQWRTIRGGASRYVDALLRPLRSRLRLRAPVRRVRRTPDGVFVHADGHPPERFDRAVLATHADQALRLLADPSETERGILGALGYQESEALLHGDARLLPRRGRVRRSWNYRIPREASAGAIVSYDVGRLQGLETARPVLVTLNPQGRVREEHVWRRMRYAHPLQTPESLLARRRHAEIDGRNGTHFCGAYWGYGFHEDGVKSALAVCRRIEEQSRR